MRGREHECLSDYFPEPGVGRSSLKAVHDQIAFDHQVLPESSGKVVDGEREFLFEAAPGSLNSFFSKLRVPLEGLNGPVERPNEVEQSVWLAILPSEGFPVQTNYIFHYRGPKFDDSSGLFQKLVLTFPFGNAPSGNIVLIRNVTEGKGDRCHAKIQLLQEEERGINELLGLPPDTSTGLTLLPDLVLATNGSDESDVFAELKESDLQKIGMSCRFDDNEDEISVRVAVGPNIFVPKLSKKIKLNYPRLMFDLPGKPSLETITSWGVGQGRSAARLN